MIDVIKPGLQTTVQDSGRPGFQRYGMSVAGAQDNYSLRVANLLVGNRVGAPVLMNGDRGDAGLEFLVYGPTLRFAEDTVVAVTGARFHPKLRGRPAPQWETVFVPAGTVLEIGIAEAGVRGYLAVAGGIDVPIHMGSRSTLIRAATGGFEGRALKAGDQLSTMPPHSSIKDVTGRRFRDDLIPLLPKEWRVGVVLGPQDYLFTEESVERFLMSQWSLSPKADRTGFRFTGPTLLFNPQPDYLRRDAGSDPSNIVDDVIPLGGLQVPSGVEVIMAGVEGLTTGGYAKIATVITADIGRVGQMRPGQTATFFTVTSEEAEIRAALQSATLDECNIVSARH